MKTRLLVTTLLLALVACKSLGLATPQTFNQKLAVGYGSATAIITTTDALLTQGKIGSGVAKNIEAQDANLKAALDIASQVYVTNQTDGGNQLVAALTALNALSAYLTTLQTPAK